MGEGLGTGEGVGGGASGWEDCVGDGSATKEGVWNASAWKDSGGGEGVGNASVLKDSVGGEGFNIKGKALVPGGLDVGRGRLSNSEKASEPAGEELGTEEETWKGGFGTQYPLATTEVTHPARGLTTTMRAVHQQRAVR